MRHRTLTRPLLASLSIAAALTACGSAPQGEPEAQSAAEALDLSNYKSAAQVFCAIFNAAPDLTVGDVSITKDPCVASQYDNFYYLGEDDWSKLYRTGPGGGPVTYPQAATGMADALYCALKDTNGAQADGRVDAGPLGLFGMLTHVAVPKYDPVAMQVVGQRLGKLYAFGVGLDIEDQDFVASFPTEEHYNGSPLTATSGSLGHYMDLQTSTLKWGLNGTGSVPPFTFGLTFGQSAYFGSWNNNLFDWSTSASQENAPNTALSWQTWDTACAVCHLEGDLICDCPNSAQTAQYYAFEAWTGAQYRNLTDGVLPYPGDQGGVSGNYVYRLPSANWTEFGPSLGGVVSGDDTHSTNSNPSTNLSFSFGLDYDIVSLDAILGLQFLSAMELTQGQATWNEAVRANTVTTMLDAGTGATLDVKLTIANPFPFGPNPLLQADFNILNASKQAHVQATSLEYNTVDGSPFYEYSTQSAGSENAPAAEAACMAAPAQNGNTITPSDPQTFLQQVANAAQGALYPCNIDLCSPTSASSSTGTLDKCTWNASTKKITCASTGQACNVCQDSVALCSKAPDGTVTTYPATSIGNDNKGCGIVP